MLDEELVELHEIAVVDPRKGAELVLQAIEPRRAGRMESLERDFVEGRPIARVENDSRRAPPQSR